MKCFSGMRARLLGLLLLVALPPVGLTLFADAERWQHDGREAQENTLRLVRLAAADQTRLLETTRQLLFLLAQLPGVRDGEQAACDAVLPALLKQYQLYANFGVIAATGEVLCSAVPTTGPVNLAGQSFFRYALETRDFVLGDYLVGSITGKPVVVAAYPVINESSQVISIFAAPIDLVWLSRFAAQAQLPVGSTLMVIDSQGKILARYPDPELWLGKSLPDAPLVRTMLRESGEGTTEVVGPDGVSRLFAFTELHGAHGTALAHLTIGIPTAVVYAQASQLFKRHVMVLGLIILLLSGLAWIGSETFFLRRIRALVQATRRLAAGDLSTRTGLPHEPGELGQLADAFDRMAAALEQHEQESRGSEQALREAYQRLRLHVENSPLAVIEWDKDLRVCQWSQQAETLFGWTAEEVIGKHPSEWRFVYEDDAERVNALLLQLLRGAASQYVCPNRNYTKNGAVLSCEWYLSALSDASGAFVSLLTFVLDVTQRQQAEEATRKSERRLRNLLDGLGPTIFVGLLSPEGVVLEVNRSALQMGGLEPGDVLGKRLEETLWWSHDESIRQRIRAAVQRAARGEAVRFDIVTRAAGDRSLVIDASLALFVDEQGVGLYVVASAVDITERKQAEEQLRSSLEQLRALTSRLHSIREEERTRMAREIHDELGQALTGLKMDLAWLDRRLAEVGNEAQRGLLLTKTQAMTQLIDETIHTVRRLASELRPGVLDNLGLLAALEWQAQDFHARTDIPCVLSTALQELALSREQETTIFRICQEALTNVMRHAQAARVDICLAQDNGCLVLEVHDDGRGITTEEIMAKESLGLLGMQERARLVNGEVTISGTAREGTTVTVRVPMGK